MFLEHVRREVYLGVKTCEVFLCFVATGRVRVYYVDFFVFFVLRRWSVLKVLTPRMSHKETIIFSLILAFVYEYFYSVVHCVLIIEGFG